MLKAAAQDSTTEPHAALMDRVYRHQRYIYDATRKYYLFGRDRLIRELDLRPGEHAVEIGCGTARNLICIARRYPRTRLYGLDASQEMLKTAARKVARAGLADRITLRHGYAEQLTPRLFERPAPFDRAIFSYSLSMIPDWHQALRSSTAALAPSGRLHVVDFGDLAGLGGVGAGLMRRWLALFHVEPRIEILGALESGVQLNSFKNNGLSVLAGRYAFVLNCGKHEISGLVG